MLDDTIINRKKFDKLDQSLKDELKRIYESSCSFEKKWVLMYEFSNRNQIRDKDNQEIREYINQRISLFQSKKREEISKDSMSKENSL